MDRNQFAEMDGLFHESDTHEWYHDHISTQYARKSSLDSYGQCKNDNLDVVCFIVRTKETGEYNRVVVDVESNKPIFDSQNAEEVHFFLSKMKLKKAFS